MKQTIYILTLTILLTNCTSKTEKGEKGDKSLSFDGEKRFNLVKTLTEADDKDKSVLLYFSSLACVNCRKMEEAILDNPEITDIISDQYLLVTLVVDDQTEAEKQFWRQSLFSLDTITRVGELNSQLQIELTQSGSQPFFAIVNRDQKVVSTTGYIRNESEFISFLEVVK